MPSPLASQQVQLLPPDGQARGWHVPEVPVCDASSTPALFLQPPAALAGLSRTQCLDQGGHLLGTSCQYVPDVTLFSFLLFGGTFLSCTVLKLFRSSRYFPAGVRTLQHGHLSQQCPRQPRPSPLLWQVRTVVSDFAAILAILTSCAVDAALGLETPKLLIPIELKVLVVWAQCCQGVVCAPSNLVMSLLSFLLP